MSLRIDMQVEKEEKALEESLNSGELSLKEYNENIRDLYREAREQECEQRNEYLDRYGW
jgi:RNA polymerase-interacting CarD/CdnL/TRCF family regulator